MTWYKAIGSPSFIKVQPPNHKLPCWQVMSAVVAVFGWLKAPNKCTDHLLLLVVVVFALNGTGRVIRTPDESFCRLETAPIYHSPSDPLITGFDLRMQLTAAGTK